MGNSGGGLSITRAGCWALNTRFSAEAVEARALASRFRESRSRRDAEPARKGSCRARLHRHIVQTLTPELAEAMKLKGQATGALVGEVTPKSPSEKPG